jgi:hypothetical protein
MLFWALLASGQINMRKVDGWKTLAPPSPSISRLTSQPETIPSCYRDCATPISNHVRAATAVGQLTETRATAFPQAQS